MIDCLFPSLAGQSLTAFVMTVIPKIIYTMVITWPGVSAVCSIAGFLINIFSLAYLLSVMTTSCQASAQCSRNI